jgi:hypothetical protein
MRGCLFLHSVAALIGSRPLWVMASVPIPHRLIQKSTRQSRKEPNFHELTCFYDADASHNKSEQNWSRNTISHFAKVETENGVRPDHAAIGTWIKYPTHVLPENQPGTLTNVVLQYIQKRRGGQ